MAALVAALALACGAAGCAQPSNGGGAGADGPDAGTEGPDTPTEGPDGSRGTSKPPGIPPWPRGVPAARGEVTGMGLVLDEGGRPRLCVGAVAESYPPQCEGIPLDGWSWRGLTDYEQAGRVRFGSYAVTGRFDGHRLRVTGEPIPAALWDPMPADTPRDAFATRCYPPPGGWRVLDRDRVDQASLQRTFEEASRLAGYAGAWIDQQAGAGPAPESEPGVPPEAAVDPDRVVVNVLVVGDEVDRAAAEETLRGIWGGALCVALAEHTEAELARIAEELASLPGMLAARPELDRIAVDVVYDDGSLQDHLDRRYPAGLVHVVSALRPVDAGRP